MPHCIPNEPEFDDRQSAEKAVWDCLRATLPDDVVLAHSVHVRNGTAQHEIDLLVLWPGVGLAAIEVKGGQVSIENGQWYQSDRSGPHKCKNPVAQSQSSMHAFKSWIGDQLGTPLHSRFAYMVAFPYTPVPSDWTLSGCPRSLMLDKEDIIAPAGPIRAAIDNEGEGSTPLAPTFLDRILPHLRGELGHVDAVIPPAEAEDQQDQLTTRQRVLLDATRDFTRTKFSGGAGSGKTWLAVEKARRLAKSGHRVGLFCYNKGLGQYLSNRVRNWRQAKPAFTGEFHECARSMGVRDGHGQQYFDIELPEQLKEIASHLPIVEKLDAIVVDEAQDFAPLWWDALLACLAAPEHGQIHAFMDDGQDVYRRWQTDNPSHSMGTADLVPALAPIHVDDNLRNTRRIAEMFKPFTDMHFTPRGVTGLPVGRVPCATDEALEVAGDCVDSLIADGWANNQIALLTTYHRHPVHQEFVDTDNLTEYWRQFHARETEFYGHVLGFKGLERSVIILCVNGFKDMSRAQEMLYVGLSRARSLLVIIGDDDLLSTVGGNAFRIAIKGAEILQLNPDTE